MDKKISILAIDDDKEILYSLQALFEYQGWNYITAVDIEQGLKAFWDNKPDIILIDYHLPKINGIEGVKMLRQFSPSVPIIVFTIDEAQEVADKFIEAGASDFALKPIKAPDLISRINLHIRLMKQENHVTYANSQKEIINKIAEERTSKGIGTATLELMTKFMAENNDYMVVEEIAKGTGLAYQTTYRYLQYMAQEKDVDVKVSYGKIGRPKQTYKLINKGK